MLESQRLTRFPSARVARPLPEAVPPRRRSVLRHALRAAAVLLLVLLLGLGALVALVLNGPVEIPLLGNRVAAAIKTALGDRYDVSARSATIGMDPALGLVVRVNDLAVVDGSGETVARVASTLVAVDPMAVLTPRAVLRSAEINDAWISVVRTAGGRMLLGTAASALPPADEGELPAAPPGGFRAIVDPVADFDRALGATLAAAERSGFEGFTAVQTTLDVWDAERGEQRRYERADLSIAVGRAGAATASVQASGYSGRWSATAERLVNPQTGEHTLSAVFSQLSLADLFPAFSRERGGVSTDIPFYGRATVRVAADGTLEEATARVDLGAGNVLFRGGRDSVLLDEASLKLRWDRQSDVLVLDPSPFFFGIGRAVVTGSIRPAGEPGDRRLSFSFEARDAILAPRDSPAPPLMAHLQVAGVADFGAKLLHVDSATVISPVGTVTAAGSLGMEGFSPSLAMAVSVSPMPVAALKQMWPPFLAGDARRWTLTNLIDGQIVAGQFQAEIPAGMLFNHERGSFPEDAIRLDLEMAGVSLKTFGAMPAIHGASGSASLVGSAFGVDLRDGKLTTPSGRTVNLLAGAFAVDNTAGRVPVARLALQLSGDAAALAETADSEPLRALRGREIVPASLSGEGSARVSASWPLHGDLDPAEIDWEVGVDIRNLTSEEPLEGRRVRNANVSLVVNPADVTIKGDAEIDGVPARVDLTFPVSGESGGGRQDIRLALDEAARERLGVGLEGFLGGTVTASVSDLGEAGPGQHYRLDLKHARIVLTALGWSKGVGVPAEMEFDLIPVSDGYRVADLVVSGDGFGFAGEVMLTSDYALVSATIRDFALRKGDSVALKLERSETGYVIDAEGEAFDLRGVMARLKDSIETADDGLGLVFNGKIKRLVGFNGESLDDATLALTSEGGRVRRFDVSGSLDGTPVTAAYADPGRGASIDFSADDAGAVFRFVNLYRRVEGGAIRLSGRQTRDGALSGVFDVADFALVGEQAMDRMVSTIGPDAVPNGLNAGRIPFDRMLVNFKWRDGLIVIDDALLRGPAVGATWSGSIDLTAAALSIAGTYLPAYRVNNMFGQIPILGLALGAGSREGLLGVTFKIDGPLSAVRVAINPLSAIAPGIFRKIFEFQ